MPIINWPKRVTHINSIFIIANHQYCPVLSVSQIGAQIISQISYGCMNVGIFTLDLQVIVSTALAKRLLSDPIWTENFWFCFNLTFLEKVLNWKWKNLASLNYCDCESWKKSKVCGSRLRPSYVCYFAVTSQKQRLIFGKKMR